MVSTACRMVMAMYLARQDGVIRDGADWPTLTPAQRHAYMARATEIARKGEDLPEVPT